MLRRTRREFGLLAGAAWLATALPLRPARGGAKPRVLVVGGGAGGASVARYLALGGGIDVSLIEPQPLYVTCFLSSLYLAGLRSLSSLTQNYDALAGRHGVTVIYESAEAIDAERKSVRLKGGKRLPYDRLVIAPGIALNFAAILGYDEAAAETMPHAWRAGPQTSLLRRQLESMEDGGLFLLAAPPNPSRCPPAPYERASLVAFYFKRFKPRCKILILDAKDNFVEQDLFQDGWRRHYPGMIEWLPAQFTDGVKAVDAKNRSVITGGDSFKPAVANIIPPQTAGRLALEAGLTDGSGWCPVDPVTFESTRQPGIHLVGDAINAGEMPKSAFAANSQAKACALAIARTFSGASYAAPPLASSCFTFIAPDDAVRNAGSYKAVAGRIETVESSTSKLEDGAEERAQAARDAAAWYDGLIRDIFG